MNFFCLTFISNKMKKILLSVLPAIAVLFATSCVNEGLDTVQAGETVQVAMSLGVDSQIATRAAAEVNADVLVYAVYDADGKLISTITGAENGMVTVKDAFSTGTTESVSLALVKGQTYTVAFWAQNSACKAYTVVAGENAMSVDVDYAGTNNDESRDAFYAAVTFTVEEVTAVEVALKRPFAQINLGVTQEDWNNAVSSGINVTESKVVISNAATSLNLNNGSVSGNAEIVYDFASIPSVETKAATAAMDLEVNGDSYKWLSMSYILTNEAKSTLDGVQFSLSTASGDVIVVDEGLNNVPVQSNWRTNIVGSVLTGNVDLTVGVDPIYYSVANVPAGDVAAFEAALADKNVKVIKLAAGEYDGVFVHNTVSKTIESADAANKAVIKGVIAVSAPVTFNNVAFAPSANSQVATGNKYIDRYERKSVVPVYAVKAAFYGCEFTGLYDTDCVVGINYGAHKKGVMLEIDNCYFQGYAYAIYSRALVSVTNSTFDQTHANVNPRAIFLYGLGDGSQGQVVFKNNVAAGKTSYTMQMMSGNYDYRNINYDVQGNTNFSVDGEAYLPNASRDFTGTTFAEGSETFKF